MKKQDNAEYLEIDLIQLMKTLWRHNRRAHHFGIGSKNPENVVAKDFSL